MSAPPSPISEVRQRQLFLSDVAEACVKGIIGPLAPRTSPREGAGAVEGRAGVAAPASGNASAGAGGAGDQERAGGTSPATTFTADVEARLCRTFEFSAARVYMCTSVLHWARQQRGTGATGYAGLARMTSLCLDAAAGAADASSVDADTLAAAWESSASIASTGGVGAVTSFRAPLLRHRVWQDSATWVAIAGRRVREALTQRIRVESMARRAKEASVSREHLTAQVVEQVIPPLYLDMQSAHTTRQLMSEVAVDVEIEFGVPCVSVEDALGPAPAPVAPNTVANRARASTAGTVDGSSSGRATAAGSVALRESTASSESKTPARRDPPASGDIAMALAEPGPPPVSTAPAAAARSSRGATAPHEQDARALAPAPLLTGEQLLFFMRVRLLNADPPLPSLLFLTNYRVALRLWPVDSWPSHIDLPRCFFRGPERMQRHVLSRGGATRTAQPAAAGPEEDDKSRDRSADSGGDSASDAADGGSIIEETTGHGWVDGGSSDAAACDSRSAPSFSVPLLSLSRVERPSDTGDVVHFHCKDHATVTVQAAAADVRLCRVDALIDLTRRYSATRFTLDAPGASGPAAQLTPFAYAHAGCSVQDGHSSRVVRHSQRDATISAARLLPFPLKPGVSVPDALEEARHKGGMEPLSPMAAAAASKSRMSVRSGGTHVLADGRPDGLSTSVVEDDPQVARAAASVSAVESTESATGDVTSPPAARAAAAARAPPPLPTAEVRGGDAAPTPTPFSDPAPGLDPGRGSGHVRVDGTRPWRGGKPSSQRTHGRAGDAVDGWSLYDVTREFRRQGALSSGAGWHVTDVNHEYALCDTYPPRLVVPNGVADVQLFDIAPFRSRERLAVLTWYCGRNGAALLRSSQPNTGVMAKKSLDDQSFMSAARVSVIFDARPRKNAIGNRAMGKGYELAGDYEGVDIVWLDIANIHVMRSSCAKFMAALRASVPVVAERGITSPGDTHAMDRSAAKGASWGAGVDKKGLPTRPRSPPPAASAAPTPGSAGGARGAAASAGATAEYDAAVSAAVASDVFPESVDASRWLRHVQACLAGAARVVHALWDRSASCLVHCSDGWDRTSQVVALAQLLMDPYYRTLRGFAVLVEKDWCSFGHMFGRRLGHGCIDRGDVNRSPVFLQWLDCVWQLTQQYPRSFEFNAAFLAAVAHHAYSCRFGTFLFNCDRERVKAGVRDGTLSLWTYLLAPSALDAVTNPRYSAASADSDRDWRAGGGGHAPLRPRFRLANLRVWPYHYRFYPCMHTPEVAHVDGDDELVLLRRRVAELEESLAAVAAPAE